jgi:hypothetical protein
MRTHVPVMESARFRPLIHATIAFVLAFDVAFLWQRYAGAHGSEFGGHPDEAGHYVTGLMVRDYVAAGFPGSPMKFAEEYYRHYPKVALGVWPPFFYVVQSAWTLPFGVGRLSLMLLMAALAALVAWQLFHALRDEFGVVSAGLAAFFLLGLPLFREYYAMVMAETLSAALMFGAMLAFGRFLDDERTSDAVWFGFLAALAILTKGTGLALALAVPLAVAFTGKWQLLTRPALWAAVAISAILAGPWTWYFRNAGREHGGWEEASPSWHFTQQAIPYYAGKLGLTLGVVFAVLLGVGLFAQLLGPRQRRGTWAAAGALIVGVFVFQCILPVGYEDRHLVSTLPAAMMFVVAGAHAVTRWYLPRTPMQMSTPVSSVRYVQLLLMILVVGFLTSQAIEFINPHRKRWSGFGEIAKLIAADGNAPHAAVLVSSDARGEGMFVSELAMHEPRPGHVTHRANKDLASMKWSGAGAHPRFDTEEDLVEYLHKARIDYVVVDDSMPDDKRGAHHEQLRVATEAITDTFWRIAAVPVIRGGKTYPTPLRAYRVKHPSAFRAGETLEINPANPLR